MKLLQLYLVILISLAPVATSAPIYAKPGCNDTCGSVRIPYPFGIGAGCYLNEWYAVDCNSSTPYLSMVNNLEVLSLNLENQTVTVNVSMISDCQNMVRNSSQMLSVDLEGSPFLFSREHNKFTVEGCGNAVISKQGIVLTGCSTICQNRTTNERNNCYGINCCQTTIPYYLKTYNVDTSGLQNNGSNAACGSAFLVDERLYSAGRRSQQAVVGDNSFVPITLRWTITIPNFSETSCDSRGKEELDLGNGTKVVTDTCTCSPIQEGSPYLLDGCQGMRSISLLLNSVAFVCVKLLFKHSCLFLCFYSC